MWQNKITSQFKKLLFKQKIEYYFWYFDSDFNKGSFFDGRFLKIRFYRLNKSSKQIEKYQIKVNVSKIYYFI